MVQAVSVKPVSNPEKFYATTLAGRKALISGASGFIGQHLVAFLEGVGVEVHGISRNASQLFHRNIHTWWRLDLQDANAVRQVVELVKPDFVFHLAGYVSAQRDLDLVLPTFQNCLNTTVNILTSVAQVNPCRVILVGSIEEPALKNVKDIVPSSPYATAKFCSNVYAHLFNTLYQLPVLTVKPSFTFGPGQKSDKLIPYIINCALHNEVPLLTSGYRRINLIFVDDVVHALVAAATAPLKDKIEFDVGADESYSIRDIAELIIELTDAKVSPEFGALLDRMHENDQTIDISTTQHALKWKPQVPLRQGLQITIDYYKTQNEIKNA